jgi:uncharacterized membrane protein (UPF0127 family)
MSRFATSARPTGTLCILLLAVIGLGGCGQQGAQQGQTLTVQIAGQAFHLELALDDASRHEGLSDRPEIDADGGMIFVFPQSAVQNFVMRRCLTPIDIIYLDPNGRVVTMEKMAVETYQRPEADLVRYSSRYPAQFAIELRGQTLDTLPLAIGDKIDLPLSDLKAQAR